ncbi:MAG: DUF4296 domain-containing protein [Gracilimonas sp.]|nr:DUF4296 domain-containing protein [Gracilimonas sp.]
MEIESNRSVLLFVIILFGGIIASCIGVEEPEKPENLISEDIYIDLLIEFQHVKTWRNSQPDSVDADSLTQLIYNRYGIDEELFQQTHRYYQQQVSEQVERIEKAIKKMDSERQIIESHIDSVLKSKEAKPDTVSDQDL